VSDYQGLLVDSRNLSLVGGSPHFQASPLELVY